MTRLGTVRTGAVSAVATTPLRLFDLAAFLAGWTHRTVPQ
jgi:ornithine cyclodeaminase/alanine dehydrogenase-like protein (mu-crystallin family)